MSNILLIEPSYKNKYPPLGLMKISSFHKKKGDNVIFFKGCSPELKNFKWDRIYIASLFTFHWIKTINTIRYYLNSVENTRNIYVGGVMATLMIEKLEEQFDINVVSGLLNEEGKIGLNNDQMIDSILPDYSIIDQQENKILDYEYPTKDCYIAYATRGCIRKCAFCAVPIIEPLFSNSLSIAHQVNAIKKKYGEKRNLLLMDNNVLASECFPQIIEEIKNLGFYKGAKYTHEKNGKKITVNRYVDFNQGIDARLLTIDKMRLFSEIAISPLRIAFDNISDKDIYIEKVRLAAEYKIKVLSNYILFNFTDTPEDFYERLKINIVLNQEFEKNGYCTRIWSFPMKYTPVLGEIALNRKHVGKHWNKKLLRGIQCVLLATHGVVGPKKAFFEEAFGRDVEEFKRILLMPETFIIRRFENARKAKLLQSRIEKLNKEEKNQLLKIIYKNDFSNIEELTQNKSILNILRYYKLK